MLESLARIPHPTYKQTPDVSEALRMLLIPAAPSKCSCESLQNLPHIPPNRPHSIHIIQIAIQDIMLGPFWARARRCMKCRLSSNGTRHETLNFHVSVGRLRDQQPQLTWGLLKKTKDPREKAIQYGDQKGIWHGIPEKILQV